MDQDDQPDRIIVVSDAVSHDDLRKSMIMEPRLPELRPTSSRSRR